MAAHPIVAWCPYIARGLSIPPIQQLTAPPPALPVSHLPSCQLQSVAGRCNGRTWLRAGSLRRGGGWRRRRVKRRRKRTWWWWGGRRRWRAGCKVVWSCLSRRGGGRKGSTGGSRGSYHTIGGNSNHLSTDALNLCVFVLYFMYFIDPGPAMTIRCRIDLIFFCLQSPILTFYRYVNFSVLLIYVDWKSGLIGILC